MEERQNSSSCKSGKLLDPVPGPFKKMPSQAKPSQACNVRALDARIYQGRYPRASHRKDSFKAEYLG